jgi:hypothetical protein
MGDERRQRLDVEAEFDLKWTAYEQDMLKPYLDDVRKGYFKRYCMRHYTFSYILCNSPGGNLYRQTKLYSKHEEVLAEFCKSDLHGVRPNTFVWAWQVYASVAKFMNMAMSTLDHFYVKHSNLPDLKQQSNRVFYEGVIRPIGPRLLLCDDPLVQEILCICAPSTQEIAKLKPFVDAFRLRVPQDGDDCLLVRVLSHFF